ncbi:acyltransferase family protein [Paenibacillus methanolicus]|uniref:Peptidoglycan/LPS O-acetylase OafA/YrhL n=1 Tax=Paenibacillus methanolicus TaxID=582686 RepID=A0A5S5C0C7_9BACL|nr:acyltransferase [Paenibacillus methanolicus]TYP71413.1 peptidoglycan/LPS O-acetylase OafA/YrhL [Paenibacillus methanolicus]
MQKERFIELDSLRGLASFSVMLHHFLLAGPAILWISKVENTPLHFFWSGHSGVLLFFLLSGFVLSLPFYKNKNLPYGQYLVKRICRIWLPYIFSVGLGILAMTLLKTGANPELSSWFNEKWANELTPGIIINHIFLIGDFHHNIFDPVYWSLIHEMRISIIFPLLIILIIRLNWKTNIAIGVFVSMLAYAVRYVLNNYTSYNDYQTGFADTLHYSFIFMAGALLAKHRDHLGRLYTMINPFSKWALFAFLVLTYTYPYWFLPDTNILHLWVGDNFVVLMGSCLMIWFSLNSKTLSKILNIRPIVFLGKISYSLYLIHTIVLLGMLNQLYGKLPVSLIWLITAVISVVLASAAYYWVEEPSIKIGNKIVKALQSKKNTIKVASANAENRF